jgi:murein DD-endopeptidase MepM/ murein hydrolase activator NlpD
MGISTELSVKKAQLENILRRQENHTPILGFPLDRNTTKKLDLGIQNTGLKKVDLSDTSAFGHFVDSLRKPSRIGIGGYDENRMMYQRSLVFGDPTQSRSIHLGVDLWGEAYTQVYTPLSGKVHSFNFNDNFGDYGATIILEHKLEEVVFFSLYGHLSLASIRDLEPEQVFEAGQPLCQFGEPEENGHWPPHLHFQLMTDMMGMTGDFPGVASIADRDLYLTICPDPNLVLRSPVLD